MGRGGRGGGGQWDGGERVGDCDCRRYGGGGEGSGDIAAAVESGQDVRQRGEGVRKGK